MCRQSQPHATAHAEWQTACAEFEEGNPVKPCVPVSYHILYIYHQHLAEGLYAVVLPDPKAGSFPALAPLLRLSRSVEWTSYIPTS